MDTKLETFPYFHQHSSCLAEGFLSFSSIGILLKTARRKHVFKLHEVPFSWKLECCRVALSEFSRVLGFYTRREWNMD
ncbi:hypothetical protein MRB53_025958 [Persea americana]|uniref:Uncharacterized protein n=1 Tax=Persea americana TaxID=3435 RepID=A0ACC2LGJ5_PERAE|nr:hypothetical protein MRB53_025958 [Persea americana]